jgi:catechol 2,3-dioxygenase-like lactoylglutathione lyase family enzyme
MKVTDLKPQLRTTDLERSIRFYTEALGFELEFRFKDFYAGIRAGNREFHLKLVDEPDPSVPFVRDGGHVHLFFEVAGVAAVARELEAKGVRLRRGVHETDWGGRELIVEDDQGHTLVFYEDLA